MGMDGPKLHELEFQVNRKLSDACDADDFVVTSVDEFVLPTSALALL